MRGAYSDVNAERPRIPLWNNPVARRGCNEQTLTCMQGRALFRRECRSSPRAIEGLDKWSPTTESGLSARVHQNQEPPLTRGFLIYSMSQVPPAQARSFFISVSSWSS